jgi:hypothetical protein
LFINDTILKRQISYFTDFRSSSIVCYKYLTDMYVSGDENIP